MEGHEHLRQIMAFLSSKPSLLSILVLWGKEVGEGSKECGGNAPQPTPSGPTASEPPTPTPHSSSTQAPGPPCTP